MPFTHELEERLQKQRGLVQHAEHRLRTMQAALGELAALETTYKDVLWRKGQQSGVKVFEAHMWLDQEIKQAMGWVSAEQRKLQNLEREAS